LEEYKQLAYKTTLLRNVNKESIQQFYKNGQFRIVSYSKNAVVHLENDSCEKLEIILSGKVAVERLDESGGILTISEFAADDILGGNLLFSSAPYYPMAITTKQATTILQINKDLIFDLCRQDSTFLKTFLEYISDHTTMLSFRLKQHINKTIRENLIIFLQRQSKEQNTAKIKLNMSKKELAEKMGVQRTSLSRELAKMKKERIIDFDIDSITLLKSEL